MRSRCLLAGPLHVQVGVHVEQVVAALSGTISSRPPRRVRQLVGRTPSTRPPGSLGDQGSSCSRSARRRVERGPPGSGPPAWAIFRPGNPSTAGMAGSRELHQPVTREAGWRSAPSARCLLCTSRTPGFVGHRSQLVDDELVAAADRRFRRHSEAITSTSEAFSRHVVSRLRAACAACASGVSTTPSFASGRAYPPLLAGVCGGWRCRDRGSRSRVGERRLAGVGPADSTRTPTVCPADRANPVTRSDPGAR